MKKGIAVILILLVSVLSSCGEKVELDETRCGSPTSFELELVSPYIPPDFEIQNSRRVDLAEPYIFISYADLSSHLVGFSVFELKGNHIKKYYQTLPIFGEEIYFGLSRNEDYWANDELVGGSYICPVEFDLGSNSLSDRFTKIFTVDENGFGEINIDLEPWTVIMDIFEERGEKLIRVSDNRFEHFSDLDHLATPTRVYFYGNKHGKFKNVTAEHENYVRERVHSAMLQYKANEGDDKAHMRIGYGIEAYLYAEAGDVVGDYIDEIRDMLDPVAFVGDDAGLAAEARNLINTAFEKNISIASLRGFGEGFDEDYRWAKYKFDEFEVTK